MSAFRAYNIDYDSSDEEVDDTKELQIEEALKLYQAAIKFHSEGPQSYQKAAKAYTELFQSDVFKYAESLSEFRRAETLPEYEELLQESYDLSSQPLVAPADNAPNTLPQIIHLSYKNHGQLLLDILRHRVLKSAAGPASQLETAFSLADDVKTPLNYFAEALDKDEADLTLWRLSSSVALLAESVRIARFCLEAVLDGDFAGVEGVLDSLGIDEMISREQLRELSGQLQDDVSLLLSPLGRSRRKALSSTLKALIDPYSDMKRRPFEEVAYSTTGTIGKDPSKYIVTSEDDDWESVGKTILMQLEYEQAGKIDFGPGASLGFKSRGAKMNDLKLLTDSVPTIAEVTIESPIQQKGAQTTIEPAASAESPTVKEQEKEAESTSTIQAAGEDNSAQPSLPSRKRSTESAGLGEVPEGGRIRSKRIRARESHHIGDTITIEGQKDAGSSQLLQDYLAADQHVFDLVGPLLSRLHANRLLSPETLREAVGDTGPYPQIPFLVAVRDAYDMMKNYSPSKAASLLDKSISEKADLTSRKAGLGAFLGHENSSRAQVADKPLFPADVGLRDWIRKINAGWLTTRDVAWHWLYELIAPGAALDGQVRSSYQTFVWADDLKSTVLDIITKADGYLYGRAEEQLQAALKQSPKSQSEAGTTNHSADDIVEMIQTLYELHLDLYTSTATTTRNEPPEIQESRLSRWASLAASSVGLRSKWRENDGLDDIRVRYIWSSVMQVSLDNSVSQSHILACMKELKVLQSEFGRDIHLPNNSLISELSEDTIDQKLRRMNMTDFFLKIFDDDDTDPVAIIEGIEPLLERCLTDAGTSKLIDPTSGEQRQIPPEEAFDTCEFIRTSSLSLRIALWRRLRDAYDAIEYVPKVVTCDLRVFELLVDELNSSAYEDLDPQQRQGSLVRWLRLLDSCVLHILSLRESKQNYLDCVDSEHLKTAISALTNYINVVHAARVFEDCVYAGQLPSPSSETRAYSYSAMVKKINDIELRAWVLLYHFLQDGMEQSPNLFLSRSQDRTDFLQAVHWALGVRGTCHGSQRLFLKLAKDELFELQDADNATNELCQVLYDLYGLKCALHPNDLFDHNCGEPELVGRKDTLKLLGFLLSQVRKLPMKDLPKTDLRAAIDKVHGTLTRPKSTDTTLMNRRICMAYIKGPVKPLNIYSCIKGTLSLSTKPAAAGEIPIASCGWYLLMGNLALHRFRSRKRDGSGGTEDLDLATTFFIHDLEYSTEQWETWYCLGQTYDLQLEECVLWSAEKLNGSSNEVASLQRCAINCYAMAISCVVRQETDEEQPGLSEQIGELYSELGVRLYSSSREPFSMKAFQIRDNEERHYNRQVDDSTYMFRAPPFTPLKLLAIWKFSAYLFREAITRQPQRWINHYMLGKCLWKILSTQEAAEDDKRPQLVSAMLHSFETAIKALPAREARRDPILEPHYKLVSIVHKLVSRGLIERAAACEALNTTTYAQKVDLPTDSEGWDAYVIRILKNLRSADKAGWHHRMTARAAQIHYEGTGKDIFGALGAKHEFTQQMFTKTMVLQVWKPEFERPGRHFVYTTRYVRLFVELLDKTGDRANYDALLRKVRKKTNDYFEHKDLWQEAYLGYLELLRRTGKITEGREETVFKTMSYEDFVLKSAVLERWCTLLPPESKSLEILREAVDIKKVNSSFIKNIPNDNLIVDAYCQLYMEVTPTLDLSVKVEDFLDDGDRPGKDAPDQATKRIKGVGRRELLRRAEAAGINPAMVSAQVLALRKAMMAARAREGGGGGGGGGAAGPAGNGSVGSRSSSELRILTSRGGDEDAASTSRNADTPKRPVFPNADDDEDESELSELDDIQSQSLEEEVRVVKAGSSPARSGVFATAAAAGVKEGARLPGDWVGRLVSVEVKTQSEEGMQDVQTGAKQNSPGKVAGPE